MSRFSSDKKIEIALFSEKEDGTRQKDTFYIREKLSYMVFQEIMSGFDTEKPSQNLKLNIPLLLAAIIGWDLKDENGVSVPCDADHITRLDFATVTELVGIVIDHYGISKKNAMQSTK